MPQSETIHLGPHDQETVSFDVSDNAESLLVSLKSSEHGEVTTLPSWQVDEAEFSEQQKSIDEYPVRMEPLGEELLLKIRNQTDRETDVTVGLREKRLLA